MALSPDLINRFAALVGDKYALREAEAQVPYLWDDRGLFQAKTPLVLRPGTVAEVAAIAALAYETGTALVPQGGSTGLVGGHLPDSSGNEILLSLGRLNQVRALDAQAQWMIAEAGVTLEAAQNAAEEAGLLFPLNIGSKGSCTIGGNLATNAGGTQAIAYGVARDLVLGLEVVLPDGRIWNGLRTLKKDNTGYDLRHLFIGAEGTLGIITAAVLKLSPRPQVVEAAWIGVPSPQAALDLLQMAQKRFGQSVTGFELMPRLLFDFVLRHLPGARDPLTSSHPWYVLMEVSAPGITDCLEAAMEEGLLEDAALATTLEQVKGFWRMREGMSEVQKAEGGSIKHDISVPVSSVPAFITEAVAACEALVPGCRVVPFGHLGDGNLHFNISQPLGADKAGFLAQWDAMNAVVHGLVQRYGGSVSAEHGIGRLKRHLLPQVKDPVELALMRDIKTLLDPKGIMNPGKVV